jgi:hypothetical protein
VIVRMFGNQRRTLVANMRRQRCHQNQRALLIATCATDSDSRAATTSEALRLKDIFTKILFECQ